MSFTALSVFYINPPMAQSAQGLEEEQVLGGSAGVGIFQKRKKTGGLKVLLHLKIDQKTDSQITTGLNLAYFSGRLARLCSR